MSTALRSLPFLGVPALLLARSAYAQADSSPPVPVEQVVAPVQTVAPRDPHPSEPPPVSTPREPRPAAKSHDSSAADMGVLVAQLGLRAMMQSSSGTDRDGTLGGGGLAGWLFANLGVGAVSARMEFRSQIGGGGGGIHGQYGGDLSFGGRLRLHERFSLLGRLGTSAQIIGNGRLLWWTVALPETDAGLQVGHGPFFFEATGLAGITLGGNHLAGDDGRRKIGTVPHVGLRTTVGVQPFVATVAWRHIVEGQNEPGTPLDSVDGGFCVVFAKSAGVVVCADGRMLRGTLAYPGQVLSESTTWYGGISLGLGAVIAGSGRDFDFKK